MTDRKHPWWMVGLVGVLVALLPVLALLQYQWIGAVSDGEQARMQRTLNAGVLRFVDDVNRLLHHAHETFLIGSITATEALAVPLTRRYRHWHTAAPHPALLKAVYWVDYDTDGTPRLHRLDTTAVALVGQSWPETLAPWRTFFARSAFPPTPEPFPDRLVPSAPPGLAIPLFSALQPTDDRRPPPRRSYVLLLLDQAYLAETIFPRLARTYFLDGDAPAYDVMIHQRDDPERVVYRSAAALTATDFDTPDAEADLGFSSRTSVTTYISGDGTDATVSVHQRDSMDADAHVDMIQDTETILHRAGEAEEVATALLPPRMRRSPDRPGGVRLSETTGPTTPWRLRIRHQAGSIEAAIATTRRRTLAVSFGILLVLGLATGLLFVSSRRARQLADRQMAFVAGVTHELRTPLAVIRSAAENLADGVITDPEQARRYGALIHGEGRRLSELVEQALALAGAQSTHATLDKRPAGVAPLVEQALLRCRPTLDEHNAAVTPSIADDLPAVYADTRTLEAALCNLITNACKYAGPAARIGLDVRQATQGQATEIQITVRDQGPGIPNDERPHLFDPFYRGRAARQAQIRGSGLGLSLVKNIIEAHGGRISVESAEGNGSAFTLHLPIAT